MKVPRSILRGSLLAIVLVLVAFAFSTKAAWWGGVIIHGNLSPSNAAFPSIVAVSGSARYSDPDNTCMCGASVTVTIEETGDQWHTNVKCGDCKYNVGITTPTVSGSYTVRIDVTDGTMFDAIYLDLTATSSCGNGVCDLGETSVNCPGDCPCSYNTTGDGLILFDSGFDRCEAHWKYSSTIYFVPDHNMTLTAVQPGVVFCIDQCIYQFSVNAGWELEEFVRYFEGSSKVDGTLANAVTLNANETYNIIYSIANSIYGTPNPVGVRTVSSQNLESSVLGQIGYISTFSKLEPYGPAPYWSTDRVLSFTFKGYLLEECGNEVCSDNETCETCPVDCGRCNACGDGICESYEACETCPIDCGSCSVCGDSICKSPETCRTCPADCGGCVVCGDGICDGTETCQSCFVDCGYEKVYDTGRVAREGYNNTYLMPPTAFEGYWTALTWDTMNMKFIPHEDMVLAAVSPDAYACGLGVLFWVFIYDETGNEVGGTLERYQGSTEHPQRLNGLLEKEVKLTANRTYQIYMKGVPSEPLRNDTHDFWEVVLRHMRDFCFSGEERPSIEDYVSLNYPLFGSTAYGKNFPFESHFPPPLSLRMKGCPLLDCGNGMCTGAETCRTCPDDCGSCNILNCGDGICGGAEVCETCPDDCGSCNVCGDGTCTPSETCATCPQDCGNCTSCGDGACTSPETCDTCPSDCGRCIVCGDGVCSGAETCGTCPIDCHRCEVCGDGICSGAETCESCPEDCRRCNTCGDLKCEGIETCDTCPRDCGDCACGDGLCNSHETPEICPQDCERNKELATFSQVLPEAKPGEEVTIFINGSDTFLQKVSVKFKQKMPSAEITFKSRTMPPAGIPRHERIVRKYLEIEHPEIENEQIENATIGFKVENAWLKTNGAVAENVVLSRFADSAWNDLQTRFVKSDNLDSYFEADSEGLSVFAVTLKGTKAITEETEGTDEGPLRGVFSQTSIPKWFTYAIIGAALIGLLLPRKKVRRRRRQKKEEAEE